MTVTRFFKCRCQIRFEPSSFQLIHIISLFEVEDHADSLMAECAHFQFCN